MNFLKKYILTILATIFSIVAFSQQKQYIGTTTGLVMVRGGIIGDSAIIVAQRDTTNHPWKDSLGVLTFFQQSLYMRISDGGNKKWILLPNVKEVVAHILTVNGLSSSTDENDFKIIQFGQDIGDETNPAALFNSREIPMGSNTIIFNDAIPFAGKFVAINNHSIDINGDSSLDASQIATVTIKDIDNANDLKIQSLPARAKLSYADQNQIYLQENGSTVINTQLTVNGKLNVTSTPAGTNITDSTLVKNHTNSDVNAVSFNDIGPVMLAKGTLSSVSQVIIDFSSYYTIYNSIEVQFFDVIPTTDNTNLYMRMSADGITFDNGSSDYEYSNTYTISGFTTVGANTSSAAAQCVLSSNINNTTGSRATGKIIFFSPNNANVRPSYFGEGFTNGLTQLMVGQTFYGQRNANQRLRAIEFIMSSGDFTSFSYKVIALKN